MGQCKRGVKPLKVWSIELFPGANPLYVKSLKDVAEMLVEEAPDVDYEVGDKITIEFRAMSRREFDDLPEWDGP